MPIIYRAHKGAPLTIEEMDSNFEHLERRLEHLETSPLVAEGIKSIKQEGDQLTILCTLGCVFGPFTLPKYLPNPKGAWQPKVRYVVGDWVNHNKAVYFCKQGHSSEAFDGQKECWQFLLGEEAQ